MHYNLFLHGFHWFAEGFGGEFVCLEDGECFYFIPRLLWQIEENVMFNVAVVKAGLA